MHEFFYNHKALAWFLAMIGICCSCFLYFRAYVQLNQTQGQDDRKKPGRPGAGGPPVLAAKPPAAQDEGKQEDLLTRLAREESTQAGSAKDATTRSLSPRTDAKYRSTHILKRPDDPEADPKESVPARDAVRAAVEETFSDASWGAGDSTTVAEPDESAANPTEAPAVDAAESGQDSALTRRVPDGVDASEGETEVDDDEGDEDVAARERKQPTGTEVIRRAKRMEEIGIHQEIQKTEVDQTDIKHFSDEERHRRLSEFGLDSDTAAKESDAESAEDKEKRLNTTQLGSILDRLDAALGDEEDRAETEQAADQPTAAAAEEPQAKTKSDAPEQPTPPASNAPAGNKPAVPDWARADSFDDDDSGSGEPEQQKLF